MYGDDQMPQAPNRIMQMRGGRRPALPAGAFAPNAPPDPSAAGMDYYQSPGEQQLAQTPPDQIAAMMDAKLRTGRPAQAQTDPFEGYGAEGMPNANGLYHFPGANGLLGKGAQSLSHNPVNNPYEAMGTDLSDGANVYSPADSALAQPRRMAGGYGHPGDYVDFNGDIMAGAGPWSTMGGMAQLMQQGNVPPVGPSQWSPSPALSQNPYAGGDMGQEFQGAGGDYGGPQMGTGGGDYGRPESTAMQKLRQAMREGNVPPAPQGVQTSGPDFFPLAAGLTAGMPQLTGDDRALAEPMSGGETVPPGPPGMLPVKGRSDLGMMKEGSTIPPKQLPTIPPPPFPPSEGGGQSQVGTMLKSLGNPQPQGSPMLAPTWDQFVAQQQAARYGGVPHTIDSLMQSWNQNMEANKLNQGTGLGMGDLAVRNRLADVEGGKLGIEQQKIDKTFDPRNQAMQAISDMVKAGFATGKPPTPDQVASMRKGMFEALQVPATTPSGPRTPLTPTPNAAPPSAGDTPGPKDRIRALPGGADILSIMDTLKSNTPNSTIGDFLGKLREERGSEFIGNNLPSILSLVNDTYPGQLKSFLEGGGLMDKLQQNPLSNALFGTPSLMDPTRRPIGENWRAAWQTPNGDDILRQQLRQQLLKQKLKPY